MRRDIKIANLNTRHLPDLRVLWVSLCLTVVSFSSAAQAPAQVPTTIALFGDSITVGYNANYSQVTRARGTTTNGLPTVYLNQLLKDGRPKRDVVVSNWGIGGSNSSQGVDRITGDLRRMTDVFVGEAQYILILYGTNDANSGISRNTTGWNIEMMIDKARASGFEPIIGTLTPVSNRDVKPRNTEIVAAAQSRNAFVVDHFNRFISEASGWRSLIEEENGVHLHPNDAGYLVIAETWFNDRLADIIDPDFNAASVVPAVNLLLSDD